MILKCLRLLLEFMSEEAIMFSTISMKIDALEAVLSPEQLGEYRKILVLKKENFIKVWGKYLSKERLEEALNTFDV